MFKVISAEFKKTVSKPGIYILSILLAIILVLGIFIYKPTVYKNTSITLNGNDVLTKYDSFIEDTKLDVEAEIQNTIVSVSYYQVQTENGNISHKENVSNLLNEFNNKLKNYLDSANDNSALAENYINNFARPELITSLQNLNNAIDTPINKAKTGSYVIVTTENNYDIYTKYYNETLNLLKTNVEKDKVADIVHEYVSKYQTKFINSINALKYPTISTNTITNLTSSQEDTKLSILYSRLIEVEEKINNMAQIAQSGEQNTEEYNYNLDPKNVKNIDALATEYAAIASTFTNMAKYTLLTSAFDAVSTNDQLNLLFLKNESKYNCESLLIRYNYLFSNNKTENSYAHPLTIGISSNTEINAYDYAYFILRLFSFVIIVYAVMSACQTIAGEIKEGSMRYFAIRPVSRSNIYFGKLISILIMSVVMIIFSAIIALLVGGSVYGFNSLNILTIFNSSSGIILHPLAMLAIYLLSFIVELMVYLSIAMLLSCLIKSDLMAVTLMLVLYIINTLLPMFVNGANTWLTYYPFSHISLYSLFGSSVYAEANNFFNLILGMKVYAGTNLGLTISMILILIIVFNILAVKRFKSKEL